MHSFGGLYKSSWGADSSRKIFFKTQLSLLLLLLCEKSQDTSLMYVKYQPDKYSMDGKWFSSLGEGNTVIKVWMLSGSSVNADINKTIEGFI
jgi:hypothetical protein